MQWTDRKKQALKAACIEVRDDYFCLTSFTLHLAIITLEVVKLQAIITLEVLVYGSYTSTLLQLLLLSTLYYYLKSSLFRIRINAMTRSESHDVVDYLGTPSPPPHPLRPVKTGTVIDKWSPEYLEKNYERFQEAGLGRFLNPTTSGGSNLQTDVMNNTSGLPSWYAANNQSPAPTGNTPAGTSSFTRDPSTMTGLSQQPAGFFGSPAFTAVNTPLSQQPSPSQQPAGPSQQPAGPSQQPAGPSQQPDGIIGSPAYTALNTPGNTREGQAPATPSRLGELSQEEKKKRANCFYDEKYERLPPELKAAAVRRRISCTKDLVEKGKDIYQEGMKLERAKPGQAQQRSSYFQYPIYNWFPESDDDPMFLNPHLSGVRLQDFHVVKLIVAAKEDYTVLAAIHNESFTKDGLRSGRVPFGRGAVVLTQLGWQWVVVGNTIMWGNYGDREDGQAEDLEGGPYTKRARRLRAWGKVPFNLVNKIPTEDNLRGIRLTWESQPAPWVVSVGDDGLIDFKTPDKKPAKFPLVELGLMPPPKTQSKSKKTPEQAVGDHPAHIFPGFDNKFSPAPIQRPTFAQLAASNFYTRYNLTAIIQMQESHPTMSSSQVRTIVAYPGKYSLATLDHLIKHDPGHYSETDAYQHHPAQLCKLVRPEPRESEGNPFPLSAPDPSPGQDHGINPLSGDGRSHPGPGAGNSSSLSRISVTPEPFGKVGLKDQGGDEREGKYGIIERYAEMAFLAERLDAFLHILNDGLNAGIRSMRLCRSLARAVANKDSMEFAKARDEFTPEKFKSFLELYENMKAAQQQVHEKRGQLEGNLDSISVKRIFTHVAGPTYDPALPIQEFMSWVAKFRVDGVRVDLEEFVKSLEHEEEDELTI
ncbi:MAG: hypothetical protein LQ339_008694 [Xanthoria mediterranea]|nr:MAG: hypothetical protein LQ339_008694 [Xanthoria mediterranea]